jgi:transcriptional regulator with XRE-family HTH domain
MPYPLYGLRARRERRGATVDALAACAGVSVATLRHLEQGSTPSFATTRRLADALELEPHTLMHPGPAFAERDSASCAACRWLSAVEAHPEWDETDIGIRILTTGYVDG